MSVPFTGFQPTLMAFLKELQRNNRREWFADHKQRYETEVLFPTLGFVEAFQPLLKKISPCFVAVPKRVGGSVMRIYRDTRFSKDKTPYKINVGIHFRHQLGKDIHCPGFYLHLEPRNCFCGAGIWHPDNVTLNKIRHHIDEYPTRWKRARDNKAFRTRFELAGDSLKRRPRGYEDDHRFIDDLKRKDHIGILALDAARITDDEFIDTVAANFQASRTYMRFLCDALRLPF
ncbi:MAG: DUF2461 domain-containing protein [Pirellulaceae bacterium]|nr:DUF2461 domain-containing protein [Pirellulaceae bacterium]